MCILFVHTGGGAYRLILASNRDEFFARPADPASAWKEDENVIGGRDMELGREGGTWLAACPSRRKAAALLNLPGEPSAENAKGRGSVVSDFVKSDTTATEYVKTSYEGHEKEYSPFNLVTVEVGDLTSDVKFYSNSDGRLRSYDSDDVLAFSNSLPDRPLQKATRGLERFREIVGNHLQHDKHSKEELVEELVSLLKWDHLHLPDEELERRRPGCKEVAGVFVKMPQNGYGTRTHTIIIVDREGTMDFIEWTKIPNETEWLKTHIQRKL